MRQKVLEGFTDEELHDALKKNSKNLVYSYSDIREEIFRRRFGRSQAPFDELFPKISLCPDCGGKGGTEGPSQYPADLYTQDMPSIYLTCNNCRGKGYVGSTPQIVDEGYKIIMNNPLLLLGNNLDLVIIMSITSIVCIVVSIFSFGIHGMGLSILFAIIIFGLVWKIWSMHQQQLSSKEQFFEQYGLYPEEVTQAWKEHLSAWERSQ